MNHCSQSQAEREGGNFVRGGSHGSSGLSSGPGSGSHSRSLRLGPGHGGSVPNPNHRVSSPSHGNFKEKILLSGNSGPNNCHNSYSEHLNDNSTRRERMMTLIGSPPGQAQQRHPGHSSSGNHASSSGFQTSSSAYGAFTITKS